MSSEDDVVQHRKDVNELEVLVDHAYAEPGRVVRVVYLDDLAVFLDGALLRLVHSEKYAHKRALARAVLAQKRVDLALSELEGDVVVCDYSGKALGYAKHLDYVFRLRCHRPAPFLT